MTDLRCEADVRALFTLAGFVVQRVWKLPNGYLGELEPLTDDQIDLDTPGQRGFVETGPGSTSGVVRSWMSEYVWRYRRPAWLVKTEIGLVEVTPRKRVIAIDWSDTAVRKIVTNDDVTKSETDVHAWQVEDALRYLKELAQHQQDNSEVRRG